MDCPDQLGDFAPVAVPGVEWPVYRRGSGPPVVVLHELKGLTPPAIEFARRLGNAGFTTYLPVLAGPAPACTGLDRATATLRICVSRDIHALRTGRTSPAVKTLRTLARFAADEARADGAGVVGMCFSGGFAIAAACDRAVLAGVAAQPSLPLPLTPWCARDLGMDAADVDTLRARLAAGQTEIYLTRFTADRLSPRARRDTVVRRLGRVTVDELDSRPGNPYGFAKGEHSVLSYAPAGYPADSPAGRRLEQSFQDVVAFLRRRLGPGPG